jgi:hypothetical protein
MALCPVCTVCEAHSVMMIEEGSELGSSVHVHMQLGGGRKEG